MTRPLAAALALLGALGIAYAAHSLTHRPPRPPVPDAMPEALEAERRVVYLVHDLGRDAGPLVCGCEAAGVGTYPTKREAKR